MRKEHPAIVEGNLRFLLGNHPQILMYFRECDCETILVIANYGSKNAKAELPEEVISHNWQRILSNQEDALPFISRGTELLPWEAEVYCFPKHL